MSHPHFPKKKNRKARPVKRADKISGMPAAGKSGREIVPVVAATAGLVVAIVAGWYIYSSYQHAKDVRESEKFIATAMDAVFREWNTMEFYKLASPGYMREHPIGSVGQLFGMSYIRLGELRSYRIMEEHADKNRADFIVEAEFSRSNAMMNISLIRDNGKWEIDNYGIR